MMVKADLFLCSGGSYFISGIHSNSLQRFNCEEGYNTGVHANFLENKVETKKTVIDPSSISRLCKNYVQAFGEDASRMDEVDDEPNKEKLQAIFISLHEIIKNHGKSEEQKRSPSTPYMGTKAKLSTEDILRLAGKSFIRSSLQIANNLSTLDGEFSDLSYGEKSDVELAHILLAAAEKVGQRGYDLALKLLSQVDDMCSDTGNPVQRIVYYFSRALRDKIDQETGWIRFKFLGGNHLIDIDKAIMSINSTNIAFHQEVPFNQVCQFAGMQAIIEYVEEAKKIHLVDLDIRTGIQCIILMKALGNRCKFPIELLKITAIGTKSRNMIEETGEHLMSFATSINIPFTFNIVMVSDMLELKRDLLDLDHDETVAVYGSYSLRVMISRKDELESLMRTMKSINPGIVVLIETEANLNSPVFVNRFVEALFHYGALFDSLEDCMDRKNKDRKLIESMYLNKAIQNIVGEDGEKRTIRHVKIGVWRAFFARFGMVEEKLSEASLYQAKLLTDSFKCKDSCSFSMDGKCLLVGWKGSPLVFVSVWKFV